MATAVLEQVALSVAKQLEDQIDDELRKLDHLQDDDLERLRQRRVEEMRRQREKTREWVARGHGEYQSLLDEKEFFKQIKGEERVVVHFYRNTMPCKVMDKHLTTLSQQHLETKFSRIDAEKSPYLTDKLKIWMLPTLALVKSEKVVGYMVGLDELGGSLDFTSEALADRLAAADMLFAGGVSGRPAGAPQSRQQQQRSVRAGVQHRTGSDEDSDFD